MKRRAKGKRRKGESHAGQTVQPDYGAIKTLVYSVLFLVSLVFLAVAVVQDVFDIFPGIKVAGMVVLGVGFLLMTGCGVWLSGRLEKRIGMAEDRAQYLSIILLFGLVALVLTIFWEQLSPLLSPMFH